MPRNIMSIGRIMYSKIPTKPKQSHFFGFGLPSIEDIQVFGVNMSFISLSEVKIFYIS